MNNFQYYRSGGFLRFWFQNSDRCRIWNSSGMRIRYLGFLGIIFDSSLYIFIKTGYLRSSYFFFKFLFYFYYLYRIRRQHIYVFFLRKFNTSSSNIYFTFLGIKIHFKVLILFLIIRIIKNLYFIYSYSNSAKTGIYFVSNLNYFGS
jgi:hypothetical protein